MKGVLDLRSVETFYETSLQEWTLGKRWNNQSRWRMGILLWGILRSEPTRRIQACLNLYGILVKYIPVPGNWNNFLVNEKPVGGDGYAPIA